MIDISLQVIPEPEDDGTTSVIVQQKLVPTFVGDGPVNFNCGECGFRVAEKMENASMLQDVVLVCPRCKSYNASRFSSLV